MNTNYKGELNHRFGNLPEYSNVRSGGAEHNPIFSCTLSLNGQLYHGTGKSKKSSEQAAAKSALSNLAAQTTAQHAHPSPAVSAPIELLIDFGTVGYIPRWQYRKHVTVWPFIKASLDQKAATRNQQISDQFGEALQYSTMRDLDVLTAFTAGKLAASKPNSIFYIVTDRLGCSEVKDALQKENLEVHVHSSVPESLYW